MKIRINILSRLSSFTLIEIIVALILSFFIIEILYLTYNIMERQFQNEYQKQLSTLVLLKSGLEMDFFYSDTIVTDQELLYMLKHGKRSSYQFNNDAIVKVVNQVKDTLFKGEYSVRFETLEKSSWVSGLKLGFKVDSEEIRMSFNKRYFPNQLLKRKEIDFDY